MKNTQIISALTESTRSCGIHSVTLNPTSMRFTHESSSKDVLDIMHWGYEDITPELTVSSAFVITQSLDNFGSRSLQ